MSRIPISAKVLWQALAAALLVVLQAVGADTEWVKDLPADTILAPILVVAIPALIGWLKPETNPAAGSASAVAALQAKGWEPPTA